VGTPIIVAQLLPLDRTEAAAVLAALGEDAPDAFLTKAEALGAAGFIESPLSLKLLRKAVAGGDDWPTTRYDLFETAIRRLVHEHNDEHRWTDRCAPDEIIAAASEACLVLLVSGSRTLWRSNAEPPSEAGDTRAYVTAMSCGSTADCFGTCWTRHCSAAKVRVSSRCIGQSQNSLRAKRSRAPSSGVGIERLSRSRALWQ